MSHVVSCLFVLIFTVVLDAQNSLPAYNHLPETIRASSLVLVTFLASPALFANKLLILEQRGVVGLLLAATSFVATRSASSVCKASDAVFSLVALSATAASFATSQEPAKQRDCNLISLAASLFVYTGLRSIRNALTYPNDVLDFTISEESGVSFHRGYAVANEAVPTVLAFAGSLSCAFGIIVLLNNDLILRVGAHALSEVAAICAVVAFTAALVAQLSMQSSIVDVPALFGESACGGSRVDCAAAFRARLFYNASNATAQPWLLAIALSMFAFAIERRFETRSQGYAMSNWTPLHTAVSLAVVVCGFAVVVFAPSDETSLVAMLLLLGSIGVVALQFPVLGCALNVAGQVLLINGASFAYYTNVTIAVSIAMVGIAAILIGIQYLFYTVGDNKLFIPNLEAVTAFLVVATLSSQFALSLAALALLAGFDGTKVEVGASDGADFLAKHFLNFFFASLLYGTRFECSLASRRANGLAWSVPAFIAIAWLAARGTQGSDPYSASSDLTTLVIGLVSAFVSWGGVGVYLV